MKCHILILGSLVIAGVVSIGRGSETHYRGTALDHGDRNRFRYLERCGHGNSVVDESGRWRS